MRHHMPQSQWVFSLLLHGFPAPSNGSVSDRVKAYRQLRLKRMVLSALYKEFEDPARRRTEEGTHHV